MPILDKLSNLGEGRKLKHLQDVARLVNTFEPEIEDLDDRGLRAKTAELRERHANGEDLDDLLPEAFAVTREGARRTIGGWKSVCRTAAIRTASPGASAGAPRSAPARARRSSQTAW